MRQHTQHDTTAIQPSPTTPNRHHTHATAYGTLQNPPPTIPTTHPTTGLRMPRHTQVNRPHTHYSHGQDNHHDQHAPAYTTLQNHHPQPQQHTQSPGNACPGIRNPTEPTHTTLTDAVNPTTRMRRHTNHDTSDDKPWPSTTNHHGPYPPAYTTRHIGHPTTADHAKPSPHACHGIRNPTEPTIRSPNTTYATRPRTRRHAQLSRTHHQQPRQHTQPPGNACLHIHNPTEPTHTTLSSTANPTVRMHRHTQHDASDDKPWPSATNHHATHAPAYTTRHIGHPAPLIDTRTHRRPTPEQSVGDIN